MALTTNKRLGFTRIWYIFLYTKRCRKWIVLNYDISEASFQGTTCSDYTCKYVSHNSRHKICKEQTKFMQLVLNKQKEAKVVVQSPADNSDSKGTENLCKLRSVPTKRSLFNTLHVDRTKLWVRINCKFDLGEFELKWTAVHYANHL